MHSDWRNKVARIRAKFTSALAALPKQGHPWLLSLSPESIGYLEACRIRDIVAATSPQDRSIFARPAGPRREWDAIVNAYHKDNVYLGEAAQLMVQNVNYDIPFIKKQITKVQQQLGDLERKEAEFKRNAIASASRYQQACQELGIAGVNVRSELLASVSALPGVFANLKDILSRPRVDEAMQLYQVYASYGNLTGEPQLLLAALKDTRDSPVELGADLLPHRYHDSTEREGKEGLDATTQQGEEDISWDIDLVDTTGDDDQESNIVWDIDVGSESQGDIFRVEETGSAVQDPVAFSCRLADSTYRNNLLNSLVEVKAFLVQRVEEADSNTTAALQSQIQAVASVSLPQYSAQALREMAGDISMALDLVTSSRTRDLLLVLTSSRFVDRLEASLKEKKRNEAKSLHSLKDVEQRKVELRNALGSSWPKQEELVSRTRQLKQCVETALCGLYKGRPVNITGEINAMCCPAAL